MEIEGEKSLKCEICGKVCKSNGGLARHTKSKYAETTADKLHETAVLEKDTINGFAEAIKTRVIDENIYGAVTNSALDTVSSTEAVLDGLLPLYETFCRKKNQDKLLESFYGLIPWS